MGFNSSIRIQKGGFELENRSNLNQVIELGLTYSVIKLSFLNQRRYRALASILPFLPSLPSIWFHSFCSFLFAVGRVMLETMTMVPYQSTSCCTSVPVALTLTFAKNVIEKPSFWSRELMVVQKGEYAAATFVQYMKKKCELWRLKCTRRTKLIWELCVLGHNA